MKKIIYVLVGVLTGLLISIPISTVSANINSIIGRTIEGSFPVVLDGVKLEKDAIVIDRTSYVPVRMVGETLNLEVTFVDSQINLKSKEGIYPMDEAKRQEEVEKQRMDKINGLEKEKSTLIKEISISKANLQKLEYELPLLEKMLIDLPNVPESQSEKEQNKIKIENKIQEVKTDIQMLKSQIKSLEAELSIIDQEQDKLRQL